MAIREVAAGFAAEPDQRGGNTASKPWTRSSSEAGAIRRSGRPATLRHTHPVWPQPATLGGALTSRSPP